MKAIKLVCFFLAIAFFLFSAQDDELLKIEGSINPRRLSRGEEGTVILKLSIQEGILISPQPAFIIEFAPSNEILFPKNFFTASDLDIEALENEGEDFLNLKDPIKIPFTINLDAKRGSHILEGKIKYFAVSRKEGWCVKNVSKFFTSFSTRSTVVKKK